MLKSPIASEILSYLIDHPDAQDTKEGIVEWWLLHQRAESVEDALSELVNKHFLEQFSGPDATVHYRIAPKKQAGFRRLRKSRKKQGGI